jgi:hypothetical protein
MTGVFFCDISNLTACNGHGNLTCNLTNRGKLPVDNQHDNNSVAENKKIITGLCNLY